MHMDKTQHSYYCGVDLHARSLFVNVLDDTGKTRLAQDLPASPSVFLDAVKPYRQGIVVGCECMFAWYWLSDLCAQEKIAFVLGHALYMKAIHGGKAKNDRIDADKIARLLQQLDTCYGLSGMGGNLSQWLNGIASCRSCPSVCGLRPHP